jgi:nitronate monooxygenase
MHSKLTDLLQIEIPIVQAPMAGVVGPELTAAVSNAGAFGTIPLWSKPVEALRDGIRQTKALTDRNFAVNLNLSFPFDGHLDACIEEGVFAVSLFWGENDTAVKKAKDADLVVMSSVGSAVEARRAVDAGADIIVAQGWEAGGHVWGTVSTMALVPAVCDVVGEVPVIAAGGIADGRGMAAAMMLGATGVWIGTRFLACKETDIHKTYLENILNASEDQTVWTHDLYDGGWPDAPHRALKNSTYFNWAKEGYQSSGERAGEGTVVGHRPTGDVVKRYQSYSPAAGTTGDVGAMSLWAGQGVAQVREVLSASDIVNTIYEDAKRLLGSKV